MCVYKEEYLIYTVIILYFTLKVKSVDIFKGKSGS